MATNTPIMSNMPVPPGIRQDARGGAERLTQEVAESRAQWEKDTEALLIALNVMQEVVRETETALRQMVVPI